MYKYKLFPRSVWVFFPSRSFSLRRLFPLQVRFLHFFSVWIRKSSVLSNRFHTCYIIWFRKFSCCQRGLKTVSVPTLFLLPVPKYFAVPHPICSHRRYKTIWGCQFFHIISSKWQILLKNSFSIFTCYRFCKSSSSALPLPYPSTPISSLRKDQTLSKALSHFQHLFSQLTLLLSGGHL